MYNFAQYNIQQYNSTTYSALLTDSVASADTIANVADYNRIAYESIPLVDNLLRFFNQIDEMALDYFNPTDTATIEYNKAAVDSVATTDAPVVVSFVKVLLESMSPADVRTFVYTTSKNESVVLSDFVSKSITDKGLPETLRLKDWISLRKTGSAWYD